LFYFFFSFFFFFFFSFPFIVFFFWGGGGGGRAEILAVPYYMRKQSLQFRGPEINNSVACDEN
jgi:hypothetical protein